MARRPYPQRALAWLRCIWSGHDLDDCHWTASRTDCWHPTVKWCLKRALCAVIDHRWWVDQPIDAGHGYCTRCGLNDHDWLPIPADYHRAA